MRLELTPPPIEANNKNLTKWYKEKSGDRSIFDKTYYRLLNREEVVVNISSLLGIWIAETDDNLVILQSDLDVPYDDFIKKLKAIGFTTTAKTP